MAEKSIFPEELSPPRTVKVGSSRTFDTFQQMRQYIVDNQPLEVLGMEEVKVPEGGNNYATKYRLRFSQERKMVVRDVLNLIQDSDQYNFDAIIERIDVQLGILMNGDTHAQKLYDLIRACIVIDRKS